jgi:hypothetical protein
MAVTTRSAGHELRSLLVLLGIAGVLIVAAKTGL